MIYQSEQRAIEIADWLNCEYGFAPARAVLTENGWTVIRSWYFA